MSKSPCILAVNPGAVSLKLSLFRGRRRLAETEGPFAGGLEEVVEQAGAAVAAAGIAPGALAAVVARGGLLGPLATGTYLVEEPMLAVLREGRFGRHASNLGGQAAERLARLVPCPAMIVDPPTCDELEDEVRVTGLAGLLRRSAYHALNHGAVARRLAAELGRPYRDCLLVIAHLGSGISVAAHRRGRVVEVNNALDGEGPFAPTRAGGLPVVDALRRLEGLGGEEAYALVTRRGGFLSLFGTADAREIEARLESGDRQADLYYRAFVYRVAREIVAQSAILGGPPEAIGLTGGLARWERLAREVGQRVAWLAPVRVYAGSFEMEALAEGALRALSGEEELRRYLPAAQEEKR